MSLKNSVTIVTGGAGLIGSQYVRGILENGGRAVIADLNDEKSKALVKEFTGMFGEKRVTSFPLNITSEESVRNLITHTENFFGTRIDALVNNAYPRTPGYGKDFFDVEFDVLSQNLSLHLGGYFLCSKVLAKYFKEKGGGNIINVSSIYGCIAPRFEIYEGTPMTNSPEYAMIKSAVIQLTKFMAKRFRGMNIRVNCISPGGVFDHQHEKFLAAYAKNCNTKGMLNPEDLSGTLVHLLSDNSKYMTGQNLIVDDGFTL